MYFLDDWVSCVLFFAGIIPSMFGLLMYFASPFFKSEKLQRISLPILFYGITFAMLIGFIKEPSIVMFMLLCGCIGISYVTSSMFFY